MKRILSLIIAIVFLANLSGCSNKKATKTNTDSSVESVSENTSVSSVESLSSSEESSSSSPSSVSSVSSSSSKVSVSSVISSVNSVSSNSSVQTNSTFTGLPALPQIKYTVNDPLNTRGISTAGRGFGFGAAENGVPHSITVNNQNYFDSLNSNALAWDNKSGEKILYLTFDCGYPYQDLVPRILKTLKEKQVKSAFFLTMQYLKEAPHEVATMINDGHIVGNHTVNHPDCTQISREKLADELLGIDNYLRTKFGYTSKYFRYPSGRHSENTIDLIKGLGYRTVFWSIAHTDWDPKNQPGVEKSFKTVTERLHPGAVILLHSTSPDNVEILGRFIDYAINEGYTFKTLDDYKYWN